MLGTQIDIIPLDTWTPDLPWYTPNTVSLLVNYIPFYGSYEFMGGYQSVHTSAALPGAVGESYVRGQFSLPKTSTGSPSVAPGVYFGTGHSLVLWDGSTIANVSAGVYNLVPQPTDAPPQHGGVWSFCMFGPERLVATSRENIVQTRTSAGGNFANLITSPEKPQGRFCAAVRGHLVLGNIYDPGTLVTSPSRVYWSARNNAAVFTPGTDRCGYIDMLDDGSPIMGIVGYESYFTVLTENGVYVFTWTGGPYVWERTLIAGTPMGTVHARSIVRHGADIYYMSTAGPAVIRNGQQVELLGEDVISGFLAKPAGTTAPMRYRGYQPTTLSEYIGFSMPSSNTVGWAYAAWGFGVPGPGGKDGQRAVIVDPRSGKWSLFAYDLVDAISGVGYTTPRFPFARVGYPLEEAVTVSNASGSNVLTVRRFTSSARNFLHNPQPFVQATWVCSGAGRASIQGIRLWHHGNVPSSAAITVYPFHTTMYTHGSGANMRHTPSEEDLDGVTQRFTLTQADADGWYTGPGLPRDVMGAVIQVSYPVVSGSSVVSSGPGVLEVAYTKESSRFA